MKKNAKRLLGLLIVLAMMVSLVGTMALADSTAAAKDPVVTYIGTSVSSGFFLEQNEEDWNPDDWNTIVKEWTGTDFNGSEDDVRMAYRPYDALVPGSAPRLVAEGLGMKVEAKVNCNDNFHKLCFTGMRTKEALRFLYGKNSLYDRSCRSDWLSEAYMNGHYSGFEKADTQYFYDHAQNWVKGSDIVIVELGGNDVMTTVIDNLFDERGTFLRSVKALNVRALHDALVDIVQKGGDLSSVVITALDAAQKAGELPLMMTCMTKALMDGTLMFYTNYGKIISRIYQLNPKAKVIAVGTFNPLAKLPVVENVQISAGILMDSSIKMMNAYMKNLAPYAQSRLFKYRFADISDVELAGFKSKSLLDLLTNGTMDNFSATQTGPIHPSADGHAYMAEQILAAIKK